MKYLFLLLCLLFLGCTKNGTKTMKYHKYWASEDTCPNSYIITIDDKAIKRGRKYNYFQLRSGDINKSLSLLDKQYQDIIKAFYRREKMKPFNPDKYYKQIWGIEDKDGNEFLVINMLAYMMGGTDSFGNIIMKDPRKHVIILNDKDIYNFFILVNLSENKCSLVPKDSAFLPR